MRKIVLIVALLFMAVCISGCKNVYHNSVKNSIEGWRWWQENYYIQSITSYEMLKPHYIRDIPYVQVYVNIERKDTPYINRLFTFYVRKDCPSSMTIPRNEDWVKFVDYVKAETHLLTDGEQL